MFFRYQANHLLLLLQHSNEVRSFYLQAFYNISKANQCNFGQEPSLYGATVIPTLKFEGYHAPIDDDREMKKNQGRFLYNNMLFIPSSTKIRQLIPIT